jgi:hypothetical protein
LIGASIGGALWIAISLIDTWLKPTNTLDAGMNLWAAEGVRHWIGANATQVFSSLAFGLVGFFVIFGLRVLLRNDIVAALTASLIFTLTRPDVFNESHLAIMLCIWIALYGALIFTLLRFGLVSTIAAVFFIDSYQYITVSTERTTWATGPGLTYLALLIAIAVFAFWRSLGSRDLIAQDAGSC